MQILCPSESVRDGYSTYPKAEIDGTDLSIQAFNSEGGMEHSFDAQVKYVASDYSEFGGA